MLNFSKQHEKYKLTQFSLHYLYGQIVNGEIDMIIARQGDDVLVDYKSYPGDVSNLTGWLICYFSLGVFVRLNFRERHIKNK